MSGSSKGLGACGVCLAGAMSLGLVAVGTSGLVAAADRPVRTQLAEEGGKRDEAPKATRKLVDAVVTPYLAVQKLLSEDETDGVGTQLKKIREAATALSKADDEVLAAKGKVIVKHSSAAPKNLDEARATFKQLSAAVIALVEVVPPSSEAAPVLYEATCEMAKANWLQSSEKISNPYMGQKMLGCGSVERKIGEAPGDEPKAQSARLQMDCCKMAGD